MSAAITTGFRGRLVRTLTVATMSGIAVHAGQAPAGGPPADTVCVDADSMLRSLQGNRCPTGTASLDLASATPEQDSAAPLRDELDGLEQRMQAFDRAARFTVVNDRGQPIFEVAPQQVRVYNTTAELVATIEAASAGGSITGRSADGAYVALLGAVTDLVGIRITERGVPRIELGRATSGNFSLRFPSPGKSAGAVAGIGESRAGTGAVVIGDAAGRAKASLSLADGKGALGIFNDDGIAILSLTQGATAGGLLAIGDARGEPMAKMGVNEDRYGIVLTGPRAGFPLIPSSGLPGSYFLGCAGGESCKP
jgi:hypothetical protein